MSVLTTYRALSEENIRELKYQCRAGIVISIFVTLIPGIVFIMHLTHPDYREYQNYLWWYLIFPVISVLLYYFLNRSYLADIKNGEKALLTKTVEKRDKYIDFVAGSGKVGCVARDMDSFTSYNLIIDNTSYKVSKELYERCAENDKVYFEIAPKSNYRLGITPFN
jgi:TctA family transporter